MLAPLVLLVAQALPVQGETLRWAVTTTFRNAGLAAVLLPAAQADLGFEIDMLVVGTGQAAGLARAGDVDAIMVHERGLEQALVDEGTATHRREIMYNDFVLVGPRKDPAGIANSASAIDALRAIAQTRAPFVSRGDDSGTHRRELALWQAAGIPADQRPVAWYKAVGAGMGTALNIASGLDAYVLADRASWLTFRNKGGLALLFAGDEALFNQYSYLPVNPARHAHVHADMAARLEAWLTGARAKALINGYRLHGVALFTFNARAEGGA
ncbi:MAG TPA: sulfate ABC transporter substrate-binding protein [Aliiroseovarius sp.]|nr:sulfate ABC transporter substrate-binding protein [Aliiroseovarius sp.]